jgi:GTP:adenosylcobinamide-phosphate guanylyltransferase
MTEKKLSQFTAIVLAGDRHENDPVAVDAGVSCKAITPIDGVPMLLRVLDALKKSAFVKTVVLCGPPQASLLDCPELKQKIEDEKLVWLANLDSPSKSVEAAITTIADDEPIFLTTADHALLSSEIVDYFLTKSLHSSSDACVGLVEYATIQKALPEVKRTVIKLRDGGVCGCNLFAFMNNNGRQLIPFWRQVEQSRKRPAQMISGILGVWGVILYLLGKLSLDNALAKVSRRLNLTVKAVLLPYPQAGVDVDTVADRELVEKILKKAD